MKTTNKKILIRTHTLYAPPRQIRTQKGSWSTHGWGEERSGWLSRLKYEMSVREDRMGLRCPYYPRPGDVRMPQKAPLLWEGGSKRIQRNSETESETCLSCCSVRGVDGILKKKINKWPHLGRKWCRRRFKHKTVVLILPRWCVWRVSLLAFLFLFEESIRTFTSVHHPAGSSRYSSPSKPPDPDCLTPHSLLYPASVFHIPAHSDTSGSPGEMSKA